jgi:TonB-dependent starch-binding outer membrane protein SusC
MEQLSTCKLSKIWILLILIAGFAPAPLLAQISSSQILVKGKVTDPAGEALVGATVLEKGTSNGTITDLEGAFSLNVRSNESVLVISFTGFGSKEETVGSRSMIDVSLTDGVNLDQVVVVGYGTQRKADLTGSVGSISAADIATRPITSLDQAMGGRLTGVHISNRSGDPGAPIEVRIRGVGTAGNNKPLWVIDGVAVELTSNATVNTASFSESNPLAGINPSDIESIDVLKDASAAAIYGARAMNGVILVTTKRGKEGRTTATYETYYGIQQVPKNRRLEVLDVPQFIALQNELGNDVSKFASKPTFDWQDALFQNGALKSHNLSVSGGTQSFTFNIGGGYHGQDGVELGQDFKRISLRANTEAKVGKRLKFGETLMFSSTNRLIQSEGGNFAAFASSTNAPYYDPNDPTNPLGYAPSTNDTRGENINAINYLWGTDQTQNETKVLNRKVLGSVYGEVEIFTGLKFRSLYGADYNVTDGAFWQEKTDINYGTGTRSSLLVQERPIELTRNFTNTLNYGKKIGAVDFSVLGGYEEVDWRYDKVRLQGNGLFSSAIQFASVATSVAAANEADHWALRSLFGRLNATISDKYLFQVNIRRDQSSKFASDNRTAIFPSFSAGWRVSEEGFFAGLKDKGLEYLKLRLSYGQLGNQNPARNFSYLPTLAINSFYALGDRVVRGPAPITFANAALGWETSTQSDFGVDIGLFNGHLDVVFDLYSKKSTDVLLSLPLPASSGYSLPADANIGSIKNSGIELGATYNNRTGGFRYSIGANITTIKNEVLDLGPIPEIISGVSGAQSHRTTLGSTLGYFYGYVTDGIYKDAAEAAAALPDAQGTASAGDIRFVDVNGDGRISSADRTNIGSSIPGLLYGANASVNWKNLDLSIFLQGVGDVEIYNQARRSLEGMNGGNNQLTTTLSRWTPSNTDTDMPRATSADPNGNNRYSDRWIESGAYTRIKNLQLGYAFPAKSLQSATNSFLSGARIFVAVQNLATFTKYKGYDPEVTRGASFQKGEFSLANGQDSGGSPQPRITQFGIQVTF